MLAPTRIEIAIDEPGALAEFLERAAVILRSRRRIVLTIE